MIDLAALKTALETDARYDVAVRSGKNSTLLTLLGEDEPGQTQRLLVRSEDVLAAIGDGLRGLNALERELLRLFTSRETVDFRKPAIRAEVRNVFDGAVPNTDVLGRLDALTERPRTYGEAFTTGNEVVIQLQDLWAVLKDIPKSAMATKKVADDVVAAANEATIAILQGAIVVADPTLKPSAARSQAIREMYDTGAQA